MPIAITDVDTLQDYSVELLKNARCRGQRVQEVLLTLAGAIIFCKGKGHPIQVHGTQASGMHNEAWIRIKRIRYAFAHDHQVGAVRIRRGSQKGQTVASFDNSDTVADVLKKFEAL
jgi:hypothetical protein